jgi:hypothetical protein
LPARKGARKSRKRKVASTRTRVTQKAVTKLITITGSYVDKDPCHLSVSKKHAVRWASADIDYTLTFLTSWPFSTPPDQGQRTVIVPANGKSKVLHLKASANTQPYAYSVQPPPGFVGPNPIVIVDS